MKNKFVFLFLFLFSCAGQQIVLKDDGYNTKLKLAGKNGSFKANNFDDGFYLGFENGSIIKVEKQSGKILWEKDLDTFANVNFSFDEKNIYFVSLNNDFYVLDKMSGEIRFIHYGANETTIINQVPPIVFGDKVLVLFYNNRVTLFSRKNWKVLKTRMLDSKVIVGSDDIKIIDGKVFIHDVFEF